MTATSTPSRTQPALKPGPAAQVPSSRRGWIPVVVLLAVLVLGWEVLSRAEVLSRLFFPAPSTTAGTLVDMLARGTLLSDTLTTLQRMASGLLIGGSAGLVVGFLSGWSSRIRDVLDPLVALVHPIPKITLLPIFMLVLGLGEAPLVLLITLSAFFPVTINAMTGVREIRPVHFEVARSFGARPALVFRRVVVPGSLPTVLAGFRIAFNIALVVTIAAEMITYRSGLGSLVWRAWETLRTSELYATLVVVAVLGVLSNSALRFAEARVARWQQ